MLKKGTMALAILLVALFAVAAVGAADNATDDIAGLNDNEVIAQEDNQLTLDDANVGSFEELSDLINRTGDGGTLKLEKHYIGSKEIVIDRNITIDGDRHILDGDFQSGIFSIEGYNVVLKNIIFLNAKSGYGGAVYAGVNSTLTVINSTFINCSANFGGALTVLSSNASIVESYFENNQATYDGGAIFSMHGILNLAGNTFKDNSANRAGAVYSSLDDLTVMSNYFVNNRAVNVGAIYAMAPKSKTISGNNIFSGNSGLDGFYETVNNNLTIFSDDNYYMFNYEYNDYEVLPKYYNMRDHNLLTPVKDQGVEGNCWAFSAMAVLESCLLKASNGTFDLSESNLKNLMAYFSDWGHAFQTNDGGNRNMAAGYFASWLGPVNEADDPYSMNSLMSPLLKSILHIQNILYLKRTNYTDNDEFKRAILLYGGISTSMYYDDAYMNGYSYYYNGMDGSNHEVCIVGWNDTYSRDNFIDAPGDGAWIVRNSWGPDWGDNGYFYVSYYDTLFAQVNETAAYTIILNDTIKFNRIYQYESHLTSFSNDDVACYKNIFTVEGEEYLAGVSTYFGDKCDYELTVYLNDNHVSSKRGKTNAGYYTIILDNPFHLNKGDKVTVVFNCTNFAGGNGTIPLSFNSSTVNLYLEEGRSFYLSNWNEWVDLCTSSNAVACIKLFTTLSLDKKINPYIFIDYNENYLDNSYLVNFILPHDALGLLELNTTNNHYIVNLSQTKSIKLYNLGDNNNTLTLRYLGDDRYLETIVNFTIQFSSNFKDLESKIGTVETGGVLDLNMNYIFDSALDDEIDISKAITIDGHGHTISGSNLSVIFNVWKDNVVLKNIKFKDAFYVENGGALYIKGSNCQIINCSFIDNAAYGNGGAIYWRGDNGVIKDSYFENNTASYGGAVLSFASISIFNSTFVNNHGSGAAIYLNEDNNIIYDSKFINHSNIESSIVRIRGNNNTIYNSSFIENIGYTILFLDNDGTKIIDSKFVNNIVSVTTVYIDGNDARLNNCTFDNSFSYSNSAALMIYGNDCVLNDCTFKNSIGNSSGGAISIVGDNCNLTNSIFINNTAQTHNGGAVYLQGNNHLIKNNTFNNNSANQCGAVCVSSRSENVVLSDSTFVDNSANLGGAIIWWGPNGSLLNSTFINNTGKYQIYWNNPDSGRIAYCKFVNSSKGNVYENNADFIKNPLSLASLQYSIEYKNPTNLSVRFNIAGGVAASSPIRFTIAKNTYNLNMVNDSVVLSDELANLDIGDVQIGVKFAGDDTYDPLESSFTLTVIKAKSSLTLKPVNATVGHQTVLSANVYSNNVALTQGSVTFYDGATNIGNADVQNGVATFTYTPTASGVHSIRAEYNDAHYETSRDSFNLYADCASVELSVASGIVGFKSTFNATVSARYSQITEGSVSFYVDNTLIETVNLQNGIATVTYTPTASGSHSVKAVYKSSRFSDASDTADFTVSKAGSQISLQTSNGKVGYTSTATATITSNNGQIINEGSVTFYDNGNPIGSVNVQNGAATLKYAPKTAGNRNISAVFSSDNYEKSSDYNMVDVSKAEVSLSINNAGTLSYLDSVTFSVSVTSNGNPVNEGRVMFYRGDVLIGTCDVSNGAVSCRYNVESFEAFDLKAVYAETGNYLALNVTKTFTVNKMPTAITANAITVVYDVTGNLIVSLRDKNGKPLSQASLSVSFNGQKTFTTDNNGQIILSSAGLAPNTYNIVVTYPGDGSYESSSATTHITVQKATPKITAAKKTFKSKLKVKKYSVTLKTHLNKPMAKVTLIIKIKGKKFSARTSAKGKATFKIKKFTKKGNFNAVITFNGNAFYNKVTKTVKIKIK